MSRTLIIGNGFDLQCGLKSTYKDFFESELYEGIEEFLDKIGAVYQQEALQRGFEHIYFNDFNDREFTSNGLSSFNVEELIAPKTFKSLSYWDLLFFLDKQALPSEWNLVEDRIKFVLDDDKNRERFSKIQQKGCQNKLSSIFFSFFPQERWESFDSYFDFLLAELHIFERNFARYIQNEVRNSNGYIPQAISWAERLLGEPLSTLTHKNIFSFNYTQPFVVGADALQDEYTKTFVHSKSSFINIHGTTLRDNVIFGIDPKGISTTKDKKFPFTKTYRQLVSNDGFDIKAMTFGMPGERDIIIFYGHSLSENDYSYFEALFDHIDLYNSNTSLIFGYSLYGDLDESKARQEMVAKATNLIYHYASTLENKDHRNNLLTMLLVTKRLSVKLF